MRVEKEGEEREGVLVAGGWWLVAGGEERERKGRQGKERDVRRR